MDTYNELKQDIKTHEGYRDHIYKDSLGLSTIFWGHLILPTDDYVEGVNYSIEDAEKCFNKDFNIALQAAEKLIGDIEVNHIQKCVIIEMVYQLGGPRTSKFKKMWQALKDGDMEKCADEMINSRWHSQTQSRCEKLAAKMRSSNK